MNNLRFWKYLSDFWDSFKDKGLFDTVWDSFHDVIVDLRKFLFQTNLNKGLDHATPCLTMDWASVVLSDANLLDGTMDTYKILYDGTADIPTLQDKISDPVNTYVLGVDYEITGTNLTWTSPTKPVPLGISLWCEEINIYGHHLRDTFGDYVGEDAIDSQEYLNLITGLMNSYWFGPDIRHIRNGLNIILGGSFILEEGLVVSLSETEMNVKTSTGMMVSNLQQMMFCSQSKPFSIRLSMQPPSEPPFPR